MAHTPEQRSKHALCGARRKKSGEPCRLFAGQGTDHPGIGRCKLHGGNTQSHNEHAVRAQVQRDMVQLGTAYEMDPDQTLLMLVSIANGYVIWTRDQIAKMSVEDFGGPHGREIWRQHNEWTERAAKYAKACIDAGIARDTLRMHQDLAGLIVATLDAAARELGLTNDQVKAIPAIALRVLERPPGGNGRGEPALPVLDL